MKNTGYKIWLVPAVSTTQTEYNTIEYHRKKASCCFCHVTAYFSLHTGKPVSQIMPGATRNRGERIVCQWEDMGCGMTYPANWNIISYAKSSQYQVQSIVSL